jgi:hypothetical protein
LVEGAAGLTARAGGIHLRRMDTTAASQRPLRLAPFAALAMAGLAIGGTLALWHREGAGIFMEMLLAGLATCF